MRALRCSSAPPIWGADPPNLSPWPPPVNPPGALDWTGRGVTIAQVLNALTEFRRRFAQAEVGDDDHPRPRNCVMTLIAVAADEADEKLAQNLCTAIAVHHPMLAIVVRDRAVVKEGPIYGS